ncbi:hypothetical protein PUNSTDRAFT_85601 [Punctularia strigosozonata HHB-11173 SS5]|uniref:uncharacterized protein n=1 Tax=Punctularia strigosozonata (strain HHB-11173) TaxID=741275 RepID=UPI0004418735|nr:uncharacterized protein PUNSTDRAFT_85601 [Punctularia strigosozonata HHB-11173 SS5]EIN11063.1 hypothetical protein PUNSTDRAFT_85601 [Punctularia strigosozonata HHB-11173 SS5]
MPSAPAHRRARESKASEDIPMTPTDDPGAERDRDAGLPLPILQSALAGPRTAATDSNGRRVRSRKSARIDRGLRVHWARFRHRLGTGTAPSTSTAPEDSTGGSSIGHRHAHTGPGSVRIAAEKDEVDEVVVDRAWCDELKSSVVSQSDQGLHAKADRVGSYVPGTSTDQESLAHLHASGGPTHTLWLLLRWRLWPATFDFFSLRFLDAASERNYAKEYWFMRKSLALWSSGFLILNWVLTVAFIPRPLVLADKIFFYGVTPAFTFPVVGLVMYDIPRDRPEIYQVWTSLATWCWAIYQSLFIFLCGFYDRSESEFTCGTKDFVGTFYYACAIPTIAIFGLQTKRFPFLLGALTFFIISAALQLPVRTTFYRNLINTLVFHCFLLYIHYMRENAERRLYTLRDQLKIQFRATQKAQVNERKASDSKRRLTSYVFHEVRVPLNTALLATQNMAASGVIQKSQEIEFKALEGSLSMMSKVLNDVLDFHRMDSGRFESVAKPYCFHQVMRSLFVPLKLATDARKLEFTASLDRNIDLIARRATYAAAGEDPAIIERLLKEHPEEPGYVVGDEMRLRQIVNNLASNAVKFTPAGGKLAITTKLLWPENPDCLTQAPPDKRHPHDAGHKSDRHHGLTDEHLQAHDRSSNPALDRVIVRIEVSDTGCGIHSKDMIHNNLFSAFNQTEMGRQQGGKGTGLGLALVRQIVKRSGGRLGVRSKVGEGSTFWVELPLGVGKKASNDTSTRYSDPLSSEFEAMVASDTAVERAKRRPRVRSTAVRGIMEQGGLVEPLTKSGESFTGGRFITPPSPATGALPTPVGTPDETGGHAPFEFIPMAEVSEHEPQAEVPAPSTPPSAPDPREKNSKSSSCSTAKPGSSKSRERPPSIELPQAPVFSTQATASPENLPSRASHELVPIAEPASPREDHRFEPGMEVLVVDDDPLTRMLMKRLLTRLGCVVSTADNGEKALEMITGSSNTTPASESVPSDPGSSSSVASSPAAERKYAIIFLDNQMPVLSGIQAVARLRRDGRDDFVVGVTGNALLSDQEEYLEAGANHVLTKPVLEKSLKNMLSLAHRRLRAS